MSDNRCVALDLEAADADEASGLLWGLGALAVQELDLGEGRVRLVAGVGADQQDRMVEAVGTRWSVDVFDADYDGWLDAWRPFAKPVRAGRVLVHPAWTDPDVRPGDIPVVIDAGRMFGQGSHVTTRLMLEQLDPLISGGESVLDVGSGSGVLGITAALLGASEVTAIDVDPEAVDVTTANAQRNGVAGVVEASSTPVGEVGGVFDVVLANILAPVLVELADDLVARVASGGALVLSGLLADQRDQVLAAYPGVEVEAESAEGDWRALTLRPPAC